MKKLDHIAIFVANMDDGIACSQWKNAIPGFSCLAHGIHDVGGNLVNRRKHIG